MSERAEEQSVASRPKAVKAAENSDRLQPNAVRRASIAQRFRDSDEPAKPKTRASKAGDEKRRKSTENAEPVGVNDPRKDYTPAKGQCKFGKFGCDVEGDGHESKRPVKHLTVLNDTVVAEFRLMNTTIDAEDRATGRFVQQKLITNSILCRESVQLLWPIRGFTAASRAAKTGLGGPLVSAPFRTDAFGYQMEAIVLPYGRNQSFGHSLGFFVQLVPGPYDPILKWPFADAVTFVLYDQDADATARLDYRLELRPGAAQPPVPPAHLARPQPGRPNGWIGADDFVSLENVLNEQNYLCDDTICLGVSVF